MALRLLALLALTVALAGCAAEPTAQSSSSGATTAPGGSATPSAIEVARAALLPSTELPLAPPGTEADNGAGYEAATPNEVSAPWAQFMVCATAERTDDVPPPEVEPGALAGAWGFGRAGAAQVDQYAIVYTDPAAAAAAVARAQAGYDDCDNAVTGWSSDPDWTLAQEPVPGGVVGFVTVMTHRAGEGSTDIDHEYSSVMQSGSVVHYMRFSPMSPGEGVPAPNELSPEYRTELLDAAAENLVGAASPSP